MRILVTAGPTRQPIDPVRFITNASSGRMGSALAAAAAAAGHEVTLLLGPVDSAVRADVPPAVTVVPFVTVDELRDALRRRFPDCDALVMAAAVGDFRCRAPAQRKLSRCGGPTQLELVPSEDVLAGVAAGKRADQTVVAFALEDGSRHGMAARARAKLAAKRADYVVVNAVAAMGAESGEACVLSGQGVLSDWAVRTKKDLANELVALLASSGT